MRRVRPADPSRAVGVVSERGIKIGDIVHAVRLATTGKAVGPGVYDCLAILGKSACLARIDRTLGKI